MRRVYLDNLKVLLIAGIIALHGLLGYSDLDVWPYGLVRETTLAPVTSGIAIDRATPPRAATSMTVRAGTWGFR